MSGVILGIYGFQRTGKSLLAFLLAEKQYKRGCKVYTNQKVEGFQTIESLEQIELNYKPKVLWLDEAYYFLDSRSWNDNKKSTLFFNSIGKLNIMLILTAINPGEVDIRLRRQHHYLIFCKADSTNIYYRLFNNSNYKYRDFTLKKEKSLYDKLRYDTLYIPKYVECRLDVFEN